jgi:hypothetical protein
VVLPTAPNTDLLAAWQAGELEPVFVCDNSHVWLMLAAA